MLERYQLLNTAPEEAYDDIVALAAFITGSPISAISLIDVERQWFKAKVGLNQSATPREQAFCAHTILQPEVLEVPNALADARFATNPLVTGEPHIRFYAGVPLVTPTGHALGSLCIIDRKPRTLSVEQRDALKKLANLVMKLFELRRISDELAQATINVKTLAGLIPICNGCKQIRNDKGYWEQVEVFIKDRTDATFTRGLCPQCANNPPSA